MSVDGLNTGFDYKLMSINLAFLFVTLNTCVFSEWVCFSVYVFLHVCICVCEREREWERGSLREREREWERVKERENEERVRERERERVSVCDDDSAWLTTSFFFLMVTQYIIHSFFRKVKV
jgi:hypothetical protein